MAKRELISADCDHTSKSLCGADQISTDALYASR